jgi:hypothetical protein
MLKEIDQQLLNSKYYFTFSQLIHLAHDLK